MTFSTQLSSRFCTTSLALAGMLLLLAISASAHRMEKRFAVQGKPVITIHNPSGRIEVKSWNKPEVMVIGNHASDRVEVDTEQAGNRIEVDTHVVGDNLKPADLKADYQITVPEESELQVRTDSGNVFVESVYGDMNFDTMDADLQLSDVQGYLVIKTFGGSVICSRCFGSIDANSISGDVQLFQPQMDNVRVQTSSGNILFDGDFLRRGIYILKNYSGTIEVRFSDTDSFDLSATSLHGNVINQANLKPDVHGRRQPTPRFGKGLFGTVNEGHAKVELSSFSGTIKILKRQ